MDEGWQKGGKNSLALGKQEENGNLSETLQGDTVFPFYRPGHTNLNICALASPKNTDVEQRSPCQPFAPGVAHVSPSPAAQPMSALPQQRWPVNQNVSSLPNHGSCCFELAGKDK